MHDLQDTSITSSTSLFYESLLFARAPIVRSTSEVGKMLDTLAPLWPYYRAWTRQREKSRRRRYGAYLVLALLAIVVFVRYWPGVQWWIFAHFRILVTMMPWLWNASRPSSSSSTGGNNDCLIPSIGSSSASPVSSSGRFAADDDDGDVVAECWSCESIVEPKRLEDATDAKAMSNLAVWTEPMLVNSSWRRRSVLQIPSISDVMALISEQYRLKNRPAGAIEPCHLATNYPRSFEEFLLRFDYYRDHAWFAQWKNCDHDIAKSLRPLCKRPDFLPRSFSSMGASWIFLASNNYQARIFRTVDVSEPWFWFTQLSGQGVLKLSPKPICSRVCRQIIVDIDSTFVALIPTSVWSVSYMPRMRSTGEAKSEQDSIAYGVESYQDNRV